MVITANEKSECEEDLVSPHGGELVNRLVSSQEKASVLEEVKRSSRIPIEERTLADIEMIGNGGFSPLQGFLNREDYNRVIEEMRLSDGILWPVPITLAVDENTRKSLKVGRAAALVFKEKIVALLRVEEIYPYDKKREAKSVYKTDEDKHPGVRAVYAQKDYYVGGQLDVLEVQDHSDFPQYNLTPRDTRRSFRQRHWKSVVAFQTRNPIHRAHEFITKCALEIVDGLLVHPIVGATKKGDIPAKVRMACYEVLLKNYYPADRVLLAINPSNMFYAGPKEALLHALVRKNYGCTHFIVGRDHAGVGSYYGTYEAQELIRSLPTGDLGIIPLCFENSFWCKRTGAMATSKTTPSSPEERVFLSGTQVREMLQAGRTPPEEFTRPEVAKILVDSMK